MKKKHRHFRFLEFLCSSPNSKFCFSPDGTQGLVHTLLRGWAVLDSSPRTSHPYEVSILCCQILCCPSCASGMAGLSESAWAAETLFWAQILTVISPRPPILHGSLILKSPCRSSPAADPIRDLLILCTSFQSALGILTPQDIAARASLMAQQWRAQLPGQQLQETRVPSLGREDPLEEEMSTHPSLLAWRIPWTVEPGGLHCMRLQRVGHNWASLHMNQHFSLLISLRSSLDPWLASRRVRLKQVLVWRWHRPPPPSPAPAHPHRFSGSPMTQAGSRVPSSWPPGPRGPTEPTSSITITAHNAPKAHTSLFHPNSAISFTCFHICKNSISILSTTAKHSQEICKKSVNAFMILFEQATL